MKTFKRFIEAVKPPKTEKPKTFFTRRKDPSKTVAIDRTKMQHARQRDALADRGKADKEKQSTEFQQMTIQQKGEMEKAKQKDKSTLLRKAAADKRKKELAARK